MGRMLDAFIAYERELRDRPATHNLGGVPVGTRLLRIIRHDNSWQLWVATRDFKYGTYYMLNGDGSMQMVTTRVDEGDDITYSRPSDDTIRRRTSE